MLGKILAHTLVVCVILNVDGGRYNDIEQAINAALEKVTFRRLASIPRPIIKDPANPVSLRGALARRRENPEIVAKCGLAADLVETATVLYAERHGGELPNTEVFSAAIAPYCPTKKAKCENNCRYRSADGSCNNRIHPEWGTTFSPQIRFLPPDYGDQFDIGVVPRSTSVTGHKLPSPREISNSVHDAGMTAPRDHIYNINLMHFGLVIFHDVISTPLRQDVDENIVCCIGDKPVKRPACFPFFTLPGEFSHTCRSFVRSEIAPSQGCLPGPSNQMNQKTSYLDLSLIYGNSIEGVQRFRQFGSGHPVSFDATLTIFHVIFLRENNKILRDLKQLGWSGESLFNETRKIMSAIYQHIVYTEYVPAVIGQDAMLIYGLKSTRYGHNTMYNPKSDATTSNVFATAAIRFAHSTFDTFEKDVIQGFSPETFQNYSNIVTNSPSSSTLFTRFQSKTDRFMTDFGRNKLWESEPKNSVDTMSFDIQRGRDHGIPSYNRWREYCGLRPILHFGKGIMGFADHTIGATKALYSVYRHPDDIDLISGAMAEWPVSGGIVGPTFACLLGEQFALFKTGDRYFYENDFHPTGFTKGQLRQIKRQSLSSVMCRHVKVPAVPQNAFISPKAGEPLVPCMTFPKLDLREWALHGRV
ncbi:peroxidase-like protein [Mytilus trossulus]|uniref:peroxidase-like protein n=1 Tax=Mytilus trossulus TaxID=6551 RepID=UPI0030060BFA